MTDPYRSLQRFVNGAMNGLAVYQRGPTAGGRTRRRL